MKTKEIIQNPNYGQLIRDDIFVQNDSEITHQQAKDFANEINRGTDSMHFGKYHIILNSEKGQIVIESDSPIKVHINNELYKI